MLLRLCQLKSLLALALVLSSCSFFHKSNHDAEELLTPMKNDWFAKNLNHSLSDQAGNIQSHHFFDINPEISKTNVYINAFVLTPQGSDHAYSLDLASGQRFYSHSYCPQHDIWNQYSGSISKPTFTIGVIPRLLDQLGEPQKVIIFGGSKKYAKNTDYHEYRIKLVGAFIEQICPEGNCLGKNNWVGRMVFMAVDPKDKKYGEILDVDDLMKIINWTETKAVIENLDGRNGGTGASYPAVRVGQPIHFYEAMEYFKKRSVFLSDTEAKKIQSGCHALYDRLWSEVGKEQPEDKPSRNTTDLNTKLKLIEELKKKRRPIGFAARFKVFVKKYFNEYSTCQRFVYAGNPNKDREAFWFYNYIGIYMRLHREGYFYDCKSHSWQKNVIDSMGRPIYDIKTGIEICKDRDFDLAMEYLPNFLTGLKSSENTYFKFDDYDTHSFGTHQKLYSWVKIKGKKYDCNFDPNPEIKKELKVFPDDVSWKPRDVKDLEDELKIIY